MNHARPVDAVLFDLDGTLVDTPSAIAEQLVGAVADVTGEDIPVERVRTMIGQPLETIASRLAHEPTTSPVVERITDAYLDRYRTQIVPAARQLLFPGVEDGLNRLRDGGLRLAIVTAKFHDSAQLLLYAAGIREYFDVIVGAEDAARPKPHPDPGLRAVEVLRVSHAAAVMVGDTSADIEMARAIPMRSIAVTFGVGSASHLLSLSPSGVADRFEDVVDAVLTTPPLTERTRREPSRA